MDEQLEAGVLLDSSVLIDFFRKKKKEKSSLFHLVNQRVRLLASVVAIFEVKVGILTHGMAEEYDDVARDIEVLLLDEECIDQAVTIQNSLTARNAIIGLPDVFIAATAIRHDLPLATLNRKHFQRVDGLELVPHRLLVPK